MPRLPQLLPDGSDKIPEILDVHCEAGVAHVIMLSGEPFAGYWSSRSRPVPYLETRSWDSSRLFNQLHRAA